MTFEFIARVLIFVFFFNPISWILWIELFDYLKEQPIAKRKELAWIEYQIDEWKSLDHPCDTCPHTEQEIETIGCDMVCSKYGKASRIDFALAVLYKEKRDLQ